MLIGLLKSIINPIDINLYENRVSYKMPTISISTILDKSYQDNVELAFSDQIPLAPYMKKGYNRILEKMAYIIIKLV